ncbi:Na+ dependent nucleoside transporter N-terminal domain-containing protein, partial [Bacillus altitudinis]
MDRFIGVIGLICIIGIAVLFSENRKKINWRLVGT